MQRRRMSEMDTTEQQDLTENVEEILHQRSVDRILGYINLKMSIAISTNSELSAIRTQIVQLASFFIVAFVLGTGGLDSFLSWDHNILFGSVSLALVALFLAMNAIRVSSEYTDIVLEEHHQMEDIYSRIVWDQCSDVEKIQRAVDSIEDRTRERIDKVNKKHRFLTGTILHTMIHFERHSLVQHEWLGLHASEDEHISQLD